MTSHAQLVRAGVVLHRMEQLLFLLPHSGGYSGTAFTGLLFPCVPDERRRSAGRHLLEAFPLLQGSGSEKRSLPIHHRTNSRSISLREGSHSGSADHSAAVPRPPQGVTSFSLLDRARPVFSFSSGRKRENGGCIAPAIAGIQFRPARKGEYTPLLRQGETNTKPLKES